MKLQSLIYKLTFPLLAGCLGLLITTSCVDDMPDPDNDKDRVEGGKDEDIQYLSFKFQVDVDPDTRAAVKGEGWNVNWVEANTQAEDFDNFVDTQDKFRVFFFTKEGDFLFGAIDRTISNGGTTGGNTQTYTVRIPMNVIVDRDGNEYPVNKLKSFLKNNEFKVAILANWPNAGEKINPGDYDDGDNSGNFGENPSSTLKGHPLWGYRNSVLYDPDNDANDMALRDKIGEKDVKNINDLHHLFDESSIYASTISTESRASNKECFEPFMALNDDGALSMGEPTDWVKMRDIDEGWHATYQRKYIDSFDSKETANQWIRANWTPDVQANIDKKIYRHYQHLWYLWNFDASYKYGLFTRKPSDFPSYASAYQTNFGWNDGFTGGVTNTWGEEWYERSGDSFFQWMYGTSSTNPLGALTIMTGTGQSDSFFTFNPFLNDEECYMVTNPASSYNNNVTYYGIRLPSRGKELAGNESPGVFVFQARTAGTIRIRWGNGHNSQEAKICIQKGREWQREYTIGTNNRYRLFNLGGTESAESYYDIAMEGENAPIYIYCSKGDAIIYGIEYIRGKYLYETDREGVEPSLQQGIPIYGVRNFQPVPDWEYGNTITIRPSDDAGDETDFRLIRALAKIELHIPDFGNERPRHVYMRNMNRAARCEPMNVEEPIFWEEQEATHPSSCEFFTLMDYGPLYDSKRTSGIDVAGYRKWLSWFYGSWKSASWFTNGKYDVDADGVWTPSADNPLSGNNKGWKFEGTAVEGEDKASYPKIFNPYINRSDFCHFIYTGKDSQGRHRYVLYMPEKFIDDASQPGVLNSNPEVPHIEFRFTPGSTIEDKGSTLTHSEFNLDDDRCFRIYFTNYGNNPGYGESNPEIGKVSGSSYKNYEKSDNLKYHWPILRNHTYQFYVASLSPERISVNVKIKDWSHEKVVTEW